MENLVPSVPRSPAMRVLYATDGSAGSQAALEILLQNFDPKGVELVDVLHVLPTPIGLAPGTHGKGSVILEANQRVGDEVVAAAVAALEARDVRAEGAVVMGHPAAEILRHAEERGCDLIIVGSRGLTGIQRLLAGSVTGKVARYARTSVLIAHSAGRVEHVLVGFDGSQAAEICLDMVARLPLLAVPRVTVATAYDAPLPFRSGVAPFMQALLSAAHAEDLAAARHSAQVTVEYGAGRLRATRRAVDTKVLHGRARDVLPTVALEIGAQLIVVGSRGLSAFERFFLGSTSASLVTQPPTNVLIVRARADSSTGTGLHPADRVPEGSVPEGRVPEGRVPDLPKTASTDY